MAEKRISRRRFLKKAGTGAIGLGAGAIGAGLVFPRTLTATAVDFSNSPAVDKKQLVAALADTIIPTSDGYPGYRRLEQYGITDEVLKTYGGISQQDMNVFNAASQEFFNGKSFVDLQEAERTSFLEMVVESFPSGSLFPLGSLNEQSVNKRGGPPTDAGGAPAGGTLRTKLNGDVVQVLQKVFRTTRTRVFNVFYQNFPENHIARDSNKIPVVKPGELHQIINPNTKQLVTGWDVANFPGPLSWDEEEARRAKWKKIRWYND
jgi:hypothetical protein